MPVVRFALIMKLKRMRLVSLFFILVFMRTSNDKLVHLLTSQNRIITSLVKNAQEIKVLTMNDPVPLGCMVNSISSDASVYLLGKTFEYNVKSRD